MVLEAEIVKVMAEAFYLIAVVEAISLVVSAVFRQEQVVILLLEVVSSSH